MRRSADEAASVWAVRLSSSLVFILCLLLPLFLSLSFLCSLSESNTSPRGFMSITSESEFLHQLPSGRCENVVLPRWKVQTVCARQALAAAWFPWQPTGFHLVATPFGSLTPIQWFQPKPSLKMHYDAGSHGLCRQAVEKGKKNTTEKIQHHLVAAVAKPPIGVIKCNGLFAYSHLLCSDTKEIQRWFIFLISSSWPDSSTQLKVAGVLRQRPGASN